MNPTITTLATTLTQNELTAWGAILGIPTALAIGFYIIIYRYYRNTDKNYNYEKETNVHISDLTTSDIKIGTNNGTKEKYIQGKNSDNHRYRVTRIQLNTQNPTPQTNHLPEIPDIIPPTT